MPQKAQRTAIAVLCSLEIKREDNVTASSALSY